MTTSPAARRELLHDPYAIVEAVAAALPEGYSVELIDGQLVALPRPREAHVVAASNLGDELGPPFKRARGGPGGWIILHEPGCHLLEDREIVAPDLAGWRRDRLADAVIPRCAHDYYEQAPDWICEVLSPGKANHDRDRVTKRALYERAGVAHYWLVDPEARTLEVYRLEGGALRQLSRHEGDAGVRAEPFDVVELRLKVLWSP